jgi:hypothetical protein
MAVRVRLGDKDRARFGCVEWLDLDFLAATVEQVEHICAETGIDIDDWPECLNPAIRFEDVGKPDARKRSPAWRNRVTVWLALNQSGYEVSWADAGKIVTNDVTIRGVEPPKDGDGPEPSESPSSGEATTLSSDTSTA